MDSILLGVVDSILNHKKISSSSHPATAALITVSIAFIVCGVIVVLAVKEVVIFL